MKNKILSISIAVVALIILALSLVKPTKANAQYYSQGENKKEVSVDKKLRSIDGSQYVDNIEASKRTFFEKDVLEFQIKVENIGNQTLNNINVKDMLPKYLGLIFNPGNFNKDNNTVEWTIDKLDPGQSKDYLIRVKIQNSTQLNVLTKETNNVEVKVDGLSDSDNASYFIGKSEVPKTGNSALIIQTALVLGLGTGGFYLRKFVRGF
ncbi:MAG: hypothetical protein WCG91_01960 [Candidatus Shapirobacteria bacterium]